VNPRRTDALPPSPVHWAMVDDWSQEGDLAASARRVSAAGAPGRAQCAALRLLASVLDAEHVLVFGSTGGVAEAWLLEGMRTTGTLTVIDADPGVQAATRDALASAPSTAVRVITGRSDAILPRLTDTGYDLIVFDAVASGSPGIEHASRLLRRGGMLVLRLDDHEAGSRGVRDESAHLRDDPRWTTAWLTVGTGLIAAVWHGDEETAAE